MRRKYAPSQFEITSFITVILRSLKSCTRIWNADGRVVNTNAARCQAVANALGRFQISSAYDYNRSNLEVKEEHGVYQSHFQCEMLDLGTRR